MSTFVHGHGAGANQLPASLGQTVSASSLSVVIASDYSLPVTVATTPSSPMYVELTDGTTAYAGTAKSQLPAALGQTTMAASLSVTLASNQSNINVSVQNATLAVTQSGAWSVSQTGTWTVQPGNTANSTPWLVTDSSDGPVTAGAVASKSSLVGVQFNTSLPTLTTGQQAALQADSSGRILVGSIANTVNVSVQNATLAVTQSGTWSIRLQDGSGNVINSTSNALNVYGAQLPTTIGAKLSAASLSVVVASDSSIAAVQSGTWTVTQSGTWTTRLNDGAGTSVTVGQKAMTASLPVTIASDQGSFPTSLTGVDYNSGVVGATTQRVVEAGRTAAWHARYDYTGTPVTNSAYTQLVASTAAACTRIRIFDSSGAALVLATGGAGSEVDQIYIPPGGFDSVVELYIASGIRVSIKSVDTTSVSTGQLLISALS